MRYLKAIILLATVGLISSCSINKELDHAVIKHPDPALTDAFIGISIYDETAGRYVYEYNTKHLFTPASNVKLLTCYASMKHLPDSLPGWYIHEAADTLYIKPNGDPTFLHPDFKDQRFFNYLVHATKPIVLIVDPESDFLRLGSGWSWNSYQATYMPERAAMPIYGNLARFANWQGHIQAQPSFFQEEIVDLRTDVHKPFSIRRDENTNTFQASTASRFYLQRPFTQGLDPNLTYRLLQDTLGHAREDLSFTIRKSNKKRPFKPFYTQPTDSVLKVMMHHSDNFIAEQLLLMVGKQVTGHLSDYTAIRKIIQEDLSTLTPAPKWVDGSGLSRNDKLAPHALIGLLSKMKAEFDWQRLQVILPHGNEGTLKGYYTDIEQNIWAKTGTLSGNIALSGYLISEKGKPYIFSFLVNNHQSTHGEVRKSIEHILRRFIVNK